MADQDLQNMMQSTINLVGILGGCRNHKTTEVMSAMMRLVTQISASRQIVISQMRGERNPDAIFAAMSKPNALAARLHANDFIGVNRRANLSFADILDVDGAELTPEATADIVVWLSVSEQTLLATRMLFQVSRLYGRAPNGKRLPLPKNDTENDS